MTLGQKIKKLRIDKGLTQKDLADQVHVTFQTVSKWENDENEPDVSTLRELSKMFDCSMDYLLSEEEVEQVKEETPVPEQVTKTIIVHDSPLHICQRCGKEIRPDELEIEQLYKTVRHGRHTSSVPNGQSYYHTSCLMEKRQQEKEYEAKVRAQRTKRAKKISFGWSIAGGAVALGIMLGILLGACHDSVPIYAAIIASVAVSYCIFAGLYCIISGSYIADIFMWCASASIRLPGLIFTWDIEGFIWVISMKILFAIITFLFGVFTLFLGIALSGILGAVSFPFVLIHNNNTNYSDSVAY